MCEPFTIAAISTGLGLASSVMQYSAQNAAYEANQQNANNAFVSEQNALIKQQIGEQDAAASDKLLMQREANAAVATAENNASATGISGLSVSGLIDSIQAQEIERQQNASTNLENTLQSIQSEKTASSNNYVSRVQSVQKPSGLSLGLGIGNALVGGVGNYYSMKKIIT